jgi:hypothetical protein
MQNGFVQCSIDICLPSHMPMQKFVFLEGVQGFRKAQKATDNIFTDPRTRTHAIDKFTKRFQKYDLYTCARCKLTTLDFSNVIRNFFLAIRSKFESYFCSLAS